MASSPPEPPSAHLFAYPKAARLRQSGDFRRVLAEAEVYPGRQVLVRRRANGVGRARLGIATPRRYGKAHVRNRLRRLVREAFRTSQAELGAFDYLVSPRKGLSTPTLEGIRADLVSTQTRKPLPPRPPGGRRRA